MRAATWGLALAAVAAAALAVRELIVPVPTAGAPASSFAPTTAERRPALRGEAPDAASQEPLDLRAPFQPLRLAAELPVDGGGPTAGVAQAQVAWPLDNFSELDGTAAGKGLRDPREPPIFAELRDSKRHPISPAVRELAEVVTKDQTNAVGKARAIYDWITRNIVYDAAEWDNLTHGATDYAHKHDPVSVLERGSTVCIGYAWLFDDMCEAAGIDATWVIGDVRGYRGTPDDALVSAFRHAWNAVRLDDGEWHLLDATWGAVQQGETPAMAQGRADYYFDTPPGQFVYDHLPEGDDWQLLEEPLPSDTAFATLPNLKPTFFTNGLRLGTGYTSVLKAHAGTSPALVVSAPGAILVGATFGDASGKEPFRRLEVATAPDGEGRVVLLPELPRGEHLLRLFSGGRKAAALECSADFVIRVE